MFGELEEAWYAGPQGIVRALVTTSAARAASHARIDVLHGDAALLTTAASTPMQTVPRTLGAATLAVRAGTVTYRLRWDASSVAATSQELPPGASARVEVQTGGRTWLGEFDFNVWDMREPWTAPDLDASVPPSLTDRAVPFAPVFQSIISRAEAMSGGAFAPVPGQFPVVQAGTAGALCDAVCWSAAGGAAAAGCPNGTAIVCVLAVSACGIAASMCRAVCRA